MDITILILVNLVIAVIMYFLFSLRFSVALEKAEKASRKTVIKELKQNIEQTIRLMDDSLDIIDQKMTTFYKLVRRAEELAELLESRGRGARKKISQKKEVPEKKITEVPVLFGNESRDEPSDHDYMDRILKNVKGEKLEISGRGQTSDDIFMEGKLTSGSAAYGAKPASGEKGGIEKLGGMIRKMLGVENPSVADSVDFRKKDEFSASGIKMKGEESSFSDILRESKNREIYKSSVQNSAAPSSKNVQKKYEFQNDHYEESNLSAGELLEKYRETHENPSRAELVRYLLRHGCVPSEISKELGVSPAEVELIASLPVKNENTRRSRIYNSDAVDEDV